LKDLPTPSAPPGDAPLKADEATLALLGRLGELQCTQDEAALIMGHDPAVLAEFLDRDGSANTAFSKGRGRGLEALRRAQFKLAETNATMAIFLGKTYLGQSERQEMEQRGAIDFAGASRRVRDKLAAVIANTAAEGDRGGR
jgi:hypothetical protein